METFDDYKRKVSIIQVAEDIGYIRDNKKGRNSPVLKLYDHEGLKLNEIVIVNPNNINQHYYDRNYQGGDLIAFIKNHIGSFHQFQHNSLFVQLNMILSHYANTGIERSKGINVHNPKFDSERYQPIPTIVEDLTYLTRERNISRSTVETFLPFIKRIKDTKSKGNYNNIAFPYTTPGFNLITNYEFRNFGFKGMAAGGDKSNSLWIADFSSNHLLVKHLYIAESAIDAMSFYELNKHKISLEDSVFTSIGGFPSHNQLKNILKHYPNSHVHTCFDNDFNGRLYDIKTHAIKANLELKILLNKDSVELNVRGKAFRIAKDELSIERFKKEARQKSLIRVHKPPVGYKDFNEVIIINKKQQKIGL